MAGGRAVAASALPRIRYGGDAAFAPFESLDATGKPRGFQIDLLAELGPVIGVDFDVSLQPWPQTEAAFRAGQFDVIAMVDTVPRHSWARFTRGHATPALTVYRRTGRAEIQGMQDLVGLRIAVIDSDAMNDTLATWLAVVPGPFVRVSGAAQALTAVQQDLADVALMPRAYAEPVLAADPALGLMANRANLAFQTYALAVAPDQNALHAQLQRGLDVLEANGRLEALRVKWLASHRGVAQRALAEGELERQRRWTWGLAGASALAVILASVAVRRRGRRIADEQQRRRGAEAALQQAQELLELTFTHHTDAMLIIEHGSGIVRDANAAVLALLGLQADRLIGRPVASLAQHIDAQALEQLVASLNSEGALNARPLHLTRADGCARDCLVSAECLLIDAVPQVFCILRDITEQLAQDTALRRDYDALSVALTQTRAELEGARQRQTQAEGTLNEFTRTVAHDLKTPLNAVLGFAGLLQQRLLAGQLQEAAAYADHIDRAAQRMTAMINALASLAQVTRQPLHRQLTEMRRLARDSWSLLAASDPGRRVDFRLEELSAAQADPDLAAQVWQNLLGNAWKYSIGVAEPRVSVSSYRNERGTWYRVVDNGAGFDMAQAQALFQPFQRMHKGLQFEGTGLGLSLVRRIIDHHGGDIRIRSQPGVGTVAEFTLDPAP